MTEAPSSPTTRREALWAEEFKELLRSTRGPQPPTPPSLYHYTSTAAALSMLRGEELWATHHAYLNDASEGQVLGTMLQTALSERFASRREASGGQRSESRPRSAASTALLSTLLQETKIGSLTAERAPYAVCFTSLADSLGQWRAYGDDGRGVALGIPFARLQGIAESVGSVDPAFFQPVVYCSAEQNRLLSALLDHACVTAERPNSVSNGNPVDEAADRFRRMYGWLSSLSKHDAFHEEREYRLVLDRLDPAAIFRNLPNAGTVWPDDLHQKSQEQFRNMSVRQGRTGLTPFVALGIGSVDTWNEVVLGPRHHGPAAVWSMHLVLLPVHNRIQEVAVRQSKAPYRG